MNNYRDAETGKFTTARTAPLNDLAAAIYGNARDRGFWEVERNMGEMLMLAVSELSEALEEHRAERPPVWYQHRHNKAY